LPWSATVRLDGTVITRKLTESAEVASLLTDVFADEEAAAAPPVVGAAAGDLRGGGGPGGGEIVGLDRAHSLLLRVLAARSAWTREEFAVLAGAHGILPDGALDLLNEAAIEAAGAPVIEGDATLAVNDDILQELLG
jgi:TerB-C domain